MRGFCFPLVPPPPKPPPAVVAAVHFLQSALELPTACGGDLIRRAPIHNRACLSLEGEDESLVDTIVEDSHVRHCRHHGHLKQKEDGGVTASASWKLKV